MMVSPFTFYRGAAKIMAADLAGTPTAGLDAQLCGDAHLSNFGGFASPERRLLFDLNDFDETLPGPFEYDVKRMAASFTIAARNNGFTAEQCSGGDAGLGAGLPGGDGRVRPDGHDGALVRPHVRGRPEGGAGPSWRSQAQAAEPARAKDREGQGRQGQGEGQGKGDKSGKEPSSRPRTNGPCSRRRRRPCARRTPGTACRPCPSSASWSTAGTGSSASRRSWCRCGTSTGHVRHVPRRTSRRCVRDAVPGVPGDPGGRPPAPAGEVRVRRRGPQGGRRRQRRHPGVHRAAAGPRRAGPAVPAGQGGDPVGAGGPPAEEPVPQPGRAGGPRASG